MLEKILYGPVGRVLRSAIAGAFSKLLIVPFLAKMPGLEQFLMNQELQNYLVLGILALIMGLAKALREKGKLPKWVPL